MRIAMAGAGMVSRHHLIGWSRQSNATVVAIADPDIDKARQRADEFGIEQTFADAAAMLDAMRPDALDIVAPMQVHAALIRLAAERCIAVMCQKPLAPTLHEAEAIAEEIGDRVRVMVHENWRFRPHYRQIAAWLSAGAIGRPRAFRMETLGSGLVRPPDGSASGGVS